MGEVYALPGGPDREWIKTKRITAARLITWGVPETKAAALVERFVAECREFEQQLTQVDIRIAFPRPPASDAEREMWQAISKIAVDAAANTFSDMYCRVRMRTELELHGIDVEALPDEGPAA